MEAALTAARAGADILGFVFAPSRRRVEAAAVREIHREIRRQGFRIKTAGVFVNPDREELLRIAEDCSLDYLQLHGEESPDFCQSLGRPVIKAFRVAGPETLAAAAAYSTDWLLLDTYSAGSYGGTGESFDWRILQEKREPFPRPFLLAGGLTPDNVAAAIQTAKPAGVDISGGVETAGKKDPEKIIAFIRAAKAAAEGLLNA
ncbi:MAG TPA: phosphoribosylanthranilate isomerase [Patescibacteria group bacterium]|nr:phosphoribosylanthranilate isomerase [Patescibacteria group bacterium]